MTYTTITTSTRDVELQDRVTAAACKEAWAGGEEFRDTVYGERLRTFPSEAVVTFMWPIAIDNEAAYEYAVNSENPSPGGDPGVISDAALQAGVQAHWPPDPYELPLPTNMVGPTPGKPVVPGEGGQ